MTETPAAPDDSGVWDFERGMHTIRNMREEEKLYKQRIRALEEGYRALSRGLPVDPGLVAEPDGEVTAMRQVFIDVGAALGLDADTISGDGGNIALLEAAKASRIAGPLALATTKAGVDHDLTAALLGQSGAIAAIDFAGDVGEQLAEAIANVKDAHPNVATRANVPTSSGVPFPSGSNGSPVLPVSREALAFMQPAEVDRLRRSGQLEHLEIGAER